MPDRDYLGKSNKIARAARSETAPSGAGFAAGDGGTLKGDGLLALLRDMGREAGTLLVDLIEDSGGRTVTLPMTGQKVHMRLDPASGWILVDQARAMYWMTLAELAFFDLELPRQFGGFRAMTEALPAIAPYLAAPVRSAPLQDPVWLALRKTARKQFARLRAETATPSSNPAADLPQDLLLALVQAAAQPVSGCVPVVFGADAFHVHAPECAMANTEPRGTVSLALPVQSSVVLYPEAAEMVPTAVTLLYLNIAPAAVMDLVQHHQLLMPPRDVLAENGLTLTGLSVREAILERMDGFSGEVN